MENNGSGMASGPSGGGLKIPGMENNGGSGADSNIPGMENNGGGAPGMDKSGGSVPGMDKVGKPPMPGGMGQPNSSTSEESNGDSKCSKVDLKCQLYYKLD